MRGHEIQSRLAREFRRPGQRPPAELLPAILAATGRIEQERRWTTWVSNYRRRDSAGGNRGRRCSADLAASKRVHRPRQPVRGHANAVRPRRRSSPDWLGAPRNPACGARRTATRTGRIQYRAQKAASRAVGPETLATIAQRQPAMSVPRDSSAAEAP